MERVRLSFQHIIHNPLNVQGNDGPAAFVGLQEEAVVGVVVEEILSKGRCAEGVLQDEEVAFPVGITVGIVFPELVPGEPDCCGPVEAVCQPVADSVGLDRYQADIADTTCFFYFVK